MPKAASVIVGEPSMMKAVTGHKGGVGYSVHVKGYEVHSSMMHRGVNAIMWGAKLIDWANAVNEENRAKAVTPLAALFDPPWTTVHVGQITGGTAHNITAGDCRFGVDFRVVPGESMAAWEARLQGEGRGDRGGDEGGAARGGDFARAAVPCARARSPRRWGAAEGLVRSITGDNGRHVVSYGTEAGQFQERGYSAVICGPGDIAQAHQPDEYITVAQFEAGERFLARVVESLCA